MESETFGTRLKAARLLSGFSLQDLANKLGNRITRQALHTYEKGDVVPDSEMMHLLCDALNVRPDFFHRTSIVELGDVNFRKLNKFPAKDKNKIIQQTKEALTGYLELEEIIGIRDKFKNPLDNMEITSAEDAEAAAEKVRKVWELGSDAISNLVELMEDKGIKVVEVTEADEFSGMQTWVKDVPVVVINQNPVIPVDRKRFTAMHELGHLLMFMQLEKLSESEREHICHRFAGAMLLPADTLKKEIGSHRNKFLINELGEIKRQYGISIQAISYRLRDLGIMTPNYHRQFIFMLGQFGLKKVEPKEYDFRGEERGLRFRQLIYRALAEDLITMSKAASLNNLKLAEFRDKFLLTNEDRNH